MTKKAATNGVQKGPPGRPVWNRTQIGLALGFVALGLTLAFGVGFIVGMWYQTGAPLTPYNAGSAPAKKRRDHDGTMTFYTTLTGSAEEVASVVGGARKRAVSQAKPPFSAQHATMVRDQAVLPSDTRYSVQVGSFRAREEAEQLYRRLAHKGYAAWIRTSLVPGKGIWYRVRVGNFPTRGAADRIAQRLESRERLSVMITDGSP